MYIVISVSINRYYEQSVHLLETGQFRNFNTQFYQFSIYLKISIVVIYVLQKYYNNNNQMEIVQIALIIVYYILILYDLYYFTPITNHIKLINHILSIFVSLSFILESILIVKKFV